MFVLIAGGFDLVVLLLWVLFVCLIGWVDVFVSLVVFGTFGGFWFCFVLLVGLVDVLLVCVLCWCFYLRFVLFCID